MAIISIEASQTGQVGVLPSYASINTSDTEASILVTGYLNKEVANGLQFALPCIAKVSTIATPAAQPQVGWYQVAHVGVNWSLVPAGSPGDVLLPTIANHIATYTGTTGELSENAATAINGGNIQAGLSGTAGFFASFPATVQRGSLRLTAVANTGDTLVTISNGLMAQSTVFTIPDPVNATARFLVGATATPLVSGRLISASGTGGLVVDSAIVTADVVVRTGVTTFTTGSQIILAKVDAVEAAGAVTASGNAGVITTSALTTAGGGTYVITWTNTMISSTSVIGLTIQGGTNNATNNLNFKATAGAGTSTLTIFNNTAATALNGTLLIGYSVL